MRDHAERMSFVDCLKFAVIVAVLALCGLSGIYSNLRDAFGQAAPSATGLTGNPLTQQGDHMIAGGLPPAASSGCGTGAMMFGSDVAGHVLTGTTTSNPCTITFHTSYITRPTCIVTGESALGSYTIANNGASFAITNPIDAVRYYWVCIGRAGG